MVPIGRTVCPYSKETQFAPDAHNDTPETMGIDLYSILNFKDILRVLVVILFESGNTHL